MSLRKHHSQGLSRKRRGMALVVTLAMLLLVTILILTFFSQAALNRQISFASAAQARADSVSQTALQTIITDLQNEIAAGSVVTVGASSNPIYMPSTNATMLPQRVGSAGLTNLVKMSVGGSNSWSGANYRFSGPVRSVVGNSTTNASANGRYIPLSSWTSPKLLTSTEISTLKAPDWVIVTRQGPLTNASLVMSNFVNKSAPNSNYVIGRYAYTVYDIGGLLDANVVGYSSSAGVNASDVARKGNLGLIAITNLPDMSVAKSDALVEWRAPSASYAGRTYVDYLRYTAATNGFMRPTPGGQGFLTRQDLIKYATQNGIANALPYLTTFSREKNSPSWSPTTPVGSSINYASLADTVSAINRNLANVRASDGTPLIKSRFDLDRLGWITYKGPSASLDPSDSLYNAYGTSANIKRFFGLSWDTSTYDEIKEYGGGQWVYTSPEGGAPTDVSMIKTLDQVAAVAREPDFFELLKATILSGSLGIYAQSEKNAAASDFAGLASNAGALVYRADGANSTRLFNEVSDYQVLAIGANVLTQYTSDGFPQSIRTAGGNVIGVKSMPYQYAFGLDAYRPIDSFANTVNRDTTFFWFKFTVWNPYRNAASPSVPDQGPKNFRIKPFSGVMQAAFQTLNQSTNREVSKAAAGDVYPTPFSRDFSVDNVSLNFTNSPSFIDPTPLTYANTTPDSTDDVNPGISRVPASSLGKDQAGIYLGKFRWPDYRVDPAWQAISGTNVYAIQPQIYMSGSGSARPPKLDPVDLRSQYLDANNNWRSYQLAPRMRYITHSLHDNFTAPVPYPTVTAPYTNNSVFSTIENAYPDPRDRRFGMTSSHAESNNQEDPVYATFRSDSTTTRVRNSIAYSYTGSGFTTGRVYSGFYADNLTTSSSSYKDFDGVTRPGDGNGTSIPSALSATAGLSRPLILNAPFHSIADIGYTYRDLPWKSLDFFTAKSADSGLLDLFTLSGGTTNALPVIAGKVNINSAPTPILQALLGNAAVEFGSDLKTIANTLSTADVNALVSSLRPAANKPIFVNKSEIVSFFATNMPSSYKIKGQREAPVRALADLTQTRTWNFLIDVVAQAGHYAPAASGVNQFMVEGEKHYWLQVAIDRFTGEVVDQQLEPVYEQ